MTELQGAVFTIIRLNADQTNSLHTDTLRHLTPHIPTHELYIILYTLKNLKKIELIGMRRHDFERHSSRVSHFTGWIEINKN